MLSTPNEKFYVRPTFGNMVIANVVSPKLKYIQGRSNWFQPAFGLDINALDGSGWSALTKAVDARNKDVISLLLRTPGIDVNLTDGRGKSAIQEVKDQEIY